MKNRNCIAILAAAFVIPLNTAQADQLTRLTDFGLPRSSNPTRLVDVNGTLFFFVPTDSRNRSELWRSDGTSAGTVLVKRELPPTWATAPVANVNETLFFGSYNQATARNELWKSDGTEAGTVRVKEFQAGTNYWSLSEFLNVNGTFFFVGGDDVNGVELWKSDGTATGTALVKDINPGAIGSYPAGLVNVNGALFFAADDGVSGLEFWKSDGTEAGTVLVKDIYPGTTGSRLAILGSANGMVFFSAYDGLHGRVALWASDGTAAGTALVKDSAWTGPFPYTAVNVNGTLFFGVVDIGGRAQLWKSDGTHAGTVLVKDIGSGTSRLVDVNGTLFFAVYAGIEGGGIYNPSLWKSDGTPAGTVLVKEINLLVSADWFARDRENAGDSSPFWLLNVNGTLFFRISDGEHGYELWKSDGTATGTALIKDIAPGSASSFPFEPANVKGTLFFVASDLLSGTELWKSDGTEAGTALVKDVYPGAGSSWPRGLLNANGMLFFNATDVSHGAELWKSDGTEAGTSLVKDINPGARGSNPGANGTEFFQFADVNGTLYFGADSASAGRGLWKTDGTEAGTVFVRDIYPYRLLNVNGTLFFAGQDRNGDDGVLFHEGPLLGSKLWKSDGTQTGTVLVKDVELGAPGYGDFTQFADVNGTLFFTSNGRWSGSEWKGTGLWKSDGTTAGTVLVKEFSGQGGPLPYDLLDVNGTLFFAAANTRLWKSDGTDAGTVLVGGGSYLQDLVNVNGTLFFGSYDAMHGNELWKSDGTAGGTMLVKDIAPGTIGSHPSKLANVNGTLYFVTDSNGELWKSDGTTEGTVIVKNPYPAQQGPFYPYQLLNVNGTLFFNAVDASHGYEFWKSDGTASGTSLIKDIHPGVGHSLLSGHPFLYANAALFFPADDGVHGFQLWKYAPDPASIDRPVLKIVWNGGQLVFSWPATLSGFSLEATTGLSSSLNWSQVPGTPTIVNGDYTFTASLTGTKTFFRLKR